MKRYYTRIKSVLDEALEGYARKGGHFEKNSQSVTKDNTHKFKHGTGFKCVKQLPGSNMDAFYALHHLKALVRDAELTKVPSSLQEWVKKTDDLTDADYRQEFHRIRLQLSTIIVEDVIHTAGSYHYPRGTMCYKKIALLSITSVYFVEVHVYRVIYYIYICYAMKPK